jgi:hypothetical protein
MHCHHVSCRPQRVLLALWMHGTCMLIREHCFKFADMLWCNVMRSWLLWLDTCSLSSYKYDTDSIHQKHALQVICCTNGHFKKYSAHLTAVFPVLFIQSTYKRRGRHYTKRYCLLKSRRKMHSIPCCDSGILFPTSKCLIPMAWIDEVLLKFVVYELMQLYTKQCSLHAIQVLAWHFMPINNTEVPYKKNPIIIYLLTYL